MSKRTLPDFIGEDLALQHADIKMETKSLIWWALGTSFSQIASYSFILEQWLEQTLQNSFRIELWEKHVCLLWLNLLQFIGPDSI